MGASKVLHFTKPADYSIWDRCVYRFCYRTAAGHPAPGHFYQVNDAGAHCHYASVCRLVVQMPAFTSVHQAVLEQFKSMPGYADYEVEPMRALEYVMFMAGSPDLVGP